MPNYYITNPRLNITDPLCNYQLFKLDQISTSYTELYQIELPDSVLLEDHGSYFTTPNDRPVDSFLYTALVKRNGLFTPCDFLRGHEPRQFQSMLQRTYGYHLVPELGYLSAEEFRKWFRKKHPEEFSGSKRPFGPYISY